VIIDMKTFRLWYFGLFCDEHWLWFGRRRHKTAIVFLWSYRDINGYYCSWPCTFSPGKQWSSVLRYSMYADANNSILW